MQGHEQTPGQLFGNSTPGATQIDDNAAELRLDVDAFVGEKSGYYWRQWSEALTHGGSVRGFNWPALLFTDGWFFFRKMYGEGLAALLAGLVLSGASLSTRNLWFAAGSHSLRIAMGFFANRLYLRKFERVRLAAGSKVGEAESGEKRNYLRSIGGTNLKAAIVATAVPFVIYLPIAAIVLFYIFR
jgi:hypothetical protein